jgi:succinate-semialdehyde dehydrogenase/glutarate-semialdehyde dehydrogenase
MTSYPELRLLINGEWRDSAQTEPVLNPADESEVGRLPHASRSDLDEALAAAAAGFEVWRRFSPVKREQIMLKAAALLRQRTEEIAFAIAQDTGKPLSQARVEVGTACERIDWDAGEGRRLYGRVIPSEPGLRHTVLREPIGIVAAFTPWNFPIASPSRKVAGALAAGCSIILKGAEETPSGAFHLIKAFHDAGVPPGAVNLVFGKPAEISEYLIPQPSVRLVTFTGSVPVGKHLASLCGRHMKPNIMELGGSSPAIICADADPEAAAAAAVLGKSRNSGQVCTSPTRFYVEEAIYEPFLAAFARGAAAVRLGDPFASDTEMGPLANIRRLQAIEALIGNRGYYFPMTVMSDLADDARLMREEPFGPVALVNRVRSIEEAIEKSNDSPFALSAYGFTGSARNVALMSEGVECGSLSINHYRASFAEAPFGGVKDSGYGREGGSEGLEGYTYIKHVSHYF